MVQSPFMKTLSTQLLGHFLMAFCFLFPALSSAVAEEAFEGRVKMKITAGAEIQTIDYFVRGDDIRVELNDPRAQGALMLMNVEKKEIRMVMPAQKMYMTMPVPDLDEEEGESAVPQATGEKKEILGYTAEKYLIELEGSDYEIWATDELGAFGALDFPGDDKAGFSSPFSRIKGEAFFPLLIIERNGDREQSRVEISEIEAKKLDDSLFEVPAGYQGMNMPAGLR